MHIPDVVGWLLTGTFLLLAFPCLMRLVRFEHGAAVYATRNADLAELLLTLAMMAMVSPIGGPIPAAGWETMLGGAATWFLVAWFRSRAGWSLVDHRHDGHYGLSALAMLYMISAMPHNGAVHGPWFSMSTVDGPSRVILPIAVVVIGYFVVDAVRSGVLVARGRGKQSTGYASRFLCRSVMGLGMGYMFIAVL
jgi:hypothetical protein